MSVVNGEKNAWRVMERTFRFGLELVLNVLEKVKSSFKVYNTRNASITCSLIVDIL